jgi:hypothetical protein
VKIFKMEGYCLILFGIINVLHEINLRATGLREPGIVYALVTAVFFTAGAALGVWVLSALHAYPFPQLAGGMLLRKYNLDHANISSKSIRTTERRILISQPACESG